MPRIDHAGVVARLEALRVHLGMSRDLFSRSFGLDPSSYSKILGDKEKPLKADYAFIISAKFGVSMDFIYRGDLSRMDEAMRISIMANLNSLEA